MKILEQPKWCWGLKDGYIIYYINISYTPFRTALFTYVHVYKS